MGFLILQTHPATSAQMTRAQAFKLFLKYFSEETLPITLSEEAIRHFSQLNPPLDGDSIRRFINASANDNDQMTEYIACCKIPGIRDYHALVYWKGTLLSHEYILATYSSQGVPISKKVIAGIKSDGESVQRSVATIEEDMGVQIVVGQQAVGERYYDPLLSQSMSLDILTDGQIVFSPDGDE